MEAFSTPRLTATKLAPEDFGDLVELHLDPDVSRFLGGVRTPEATFAYLETNLRHWDDHGVGLWTLRKRDGTFIGRAGLRYVEVEGVRELEIAYTFLKNGWGRGLGTEIAKALVQVWETHLSDASLVGLVVKGNSASERILLKAGFSYQRDAVFHDQSCGLFRRLR
jgi:RimJ/RimL family protein N-acetyltransferase